MKPEDIQQVALVTGASSGFGRSVACLLAKHGYRVFGTSRKQNSAMPPGVELLALDVRSDESVQSCTEKLLSLSDRLDLLVNNAGQIHASFIEETNFELARDLFETNFWGVVRVTNAVLPMMRRQRSGRIINVSSLAGLVGTVGQGFYSASKFALEGYSETLSIEVESFNIKVSLIEPGFFKTNLSHAATHDPRHISDYKYSRDAVAAAIREGVSRGGDPADVAELIMRVAQASSPALRYRIGNDAIWVPRLKAILPQYLFRLGLRKRFNLAE